MIFQINTTENYEYVDASFVHVDNEGVLRAYTENGEGDDPVAIWTPGFWLSVKNVEKVVDDAGNQVPEVRSQRDTDRPDA